MTQNFEELYNKLKEEYEAVKKDNDEICKEYESTIEMLSDSVEEFKKEKENLEIKLSKYEQEQKNFKKEKESLMSKNKDKILDIQNLNKQNERLTIEINHLKEERTLFDSKIVALENENDHFQNKLREYEALADDLEGQLESALEENITLQNEFETFKQTTGEKLIRKEDEIKDMKNDLANKDKFIQKLQRGNNSLLLKNIKNTFDESSLKDRRRFTIFPGKLSSEIPLFSNFPMNEIPNDDIGKSDKKKKATNGKINKDKDFNANINNKRKSVFTPRIESFIKLVQIKNELKRDISGKIAESDINKNKSGIKNNSKMSLISRKNTLAEKIEEKSENSENSISRASSAKKLPIFEITQEQHFSFISYFTTPQNSNSQSVNKNDNEKVMLDILQRLFERTKKKKEKLINIKKNREKIKKLKQKN